MLRRRAYLRVLALVSSFPFVPARLDLTLERLPADRHLIFWLRFRQALRDDQAMSTHRAREKAVEDLCFECVTKGEAVQALELANKGHYSIDDIPDKARNWFEQFDESVDTVM